MIKRKVLDLVESSQEQQEEEKSAKRSRKAVLTRDAFEQKLNSPWLVTNVFPKEYLERCTLDKETGNPKSLFDTLKTEMPWNFRRYVGWKSYSPRGIVEVSTAPDIIYHYSGQGTKPILWSSQPFLEVLLETMQKTIDSRINQATMNYYRTGHDSIAAHQDQEGDVDPEVPIYVISLYPEKTPSLMFREIVFTNDQSRFRYKHGNNEMVVLFGPLRSEWFHEIPRGKTGVNYAERISIACRKILSSAEKAEKNPSKNMQFYE